MSRQFDVVQASLNGMWRGVLESCPHRRGVRDSVDACDANKMRPCIYETDKNPIPCELFQQIIEEWRIELEICPECGQVRAGDERVRAGMKCGFCAYGYGGVDSGGIGVR